VADKSSKIFFTAAFQLRRRALLRSKKEKERDIKSKSSPAGGAPAAEN
jgi:hypothetical protein